MNCGVAAHPRVAVSRTRKFASVRSLRTQLWGVPGPHAVVLDAPPLAGRVNDVALPASVPCRAVVATSVPKVDPPFHDSAALSVEPAHAALIQASVSRTWIPTIDSTWPEPGLGTAAPPLSSPNALHCWVARLVDVRP